MERLKKFYEEAHFDKDHEEVKEIEETVSNLVNEIAEDIGKKDPLFKNFVFKSGSFYEDLKAEGPNEFDFMICLEELSKPGVCVTKEIPFRDVLDPGYVHVQVEEPSAHERWQSYISRKQLLKPKKLLKKFNSLVDDFFKSGERDPSCWGKLMAEHVYVELRKIPVTVKMTWNGDKYKNYEICIDLVLCIKMDEWPIASDLKHRSDRGHPGYDAFQEAIQGGHHLVASTIGEAGKPRPCWRLSFSRAEGIVLKHILKNPKLVHRKTVTILKVIRKRNEHKLCLLEEEEVDPELVIIFPTAISYSMITWALHSYVIKTMFLQEWFEYPQDSFWTEDQLTKRIHGILQRISDSLALKDIRSFWIQQYKLFNFRARRRTRTKACEEGLSSLLEQIKNM